MNTRLSHEELDILEALLGKININENFSIASLHAIHVIFPIHTNSEGRKDLSKTDPIRAEFRKRGVYKNITNWLIENNFSLESGKKEPDIELKLTHSGEVLWAYGDYYKYFKTFDPPTQDEILLNLRNIIEMAPLYGEFAITYKTPKTQIINIDIFSGNDDEERRKIDDAISGRNNLITIHEKSLIDESTMQYLVNEGYAINRHDIQNQNRTYRQLTDKGRFLKEAGSIEAYNERLKMESQKALEKEKLNDSLIRSSLLSNQVNLWIAVGVIVAAAYYILEILRIQYHLGLPKHVLFP